MSEARWPQIAGAIQAGAHLLPVRVYYEDTDFSGVVYHASYLRFMERGRTDFMRLAGAGQGDLFAGTGAAFAVRRMTVSFNRPAVMDDVLEVGTRVHETRGASLTLDQAVMRAGDALVEARVQVALVARSGRAVRIPPELRRVLDGFARVG